MVRRRAGAHLTTAAGRTSGKGFPEPGKQQVRTLQQDLLHLRCVVPTKLPYALHDVTRSRQTVKRWRWRAWARDEYDTRLYDRIRRVLPEDVIKHALSTELADGIELHEQECADGVKKDFQYAVSTLRA